MHCKQTVSLLVLTLAAGAACADFQQAAAPSRRHAVAGDVALGVIVSETDDRLELDTNPCASEPTLIVFRKPYAKDVIQTLHCASAPATQVQVVQQ